MATKTPGEFEASSSWCYRFARYQALPEIVDMPEARKGDAFRLIDLSKRVLNKHLSAEQQKERFERARSDATISVASMVKFYIPYIAENTGKLANLGGGMFCLPHEPGIDVDEVETEAVDAAERAGAQDAEPLSGWIYAFTFPMIRKAGDRYPIKVGMTVGDVDNRVTMQCRQTACFEPPEILKSWKVQRVGSMEAAIHNTLKQRNRWREDAPGTEWFNTTLEEIESIIAFVQSGPDSVKA